jgi:hypothetical protein
MPRQDTAVQTPQSPEAVARVLHLLKRRSFRVREAEVRLPADGLRRGLRLDFLLACRNQVFGAEVKAARRLADWLFHSLALPILALQAARRLKGWEPLLAIHVEALERRSVQRFKAQAALYAPELWWLLADAQGHVIAHLPGGDEEVIEDRPHGRRPAAPSPAAWPARVPPARPGYASAKLSFGDLDQWLLKVLIFARAEAGGWGGPQGNVRNLAQLAQLAGVARPLVYRWAAAMERSGYLVRQFGRRPLLQNGESLLGEWRGRYRISDNEALPCVPFFGERIDAAFLAGFLDRLRRLPAEAPAVALTGHQACRLFHVKHSDARSIHLYVTGDPAALLEPLQVVPSESATAPIVLLRPRHPRSALGGVSPVDGVPVCDPLQVYLDLYHLPDRGREQAEIVEERLLTAVLRQAAEAPHAL